MYEAASSFRRVKCPSHCSIVRINPSLIRLHLPLAVSQNAEHVFLVHFIILFQSFASFQLPMHRQVRIVCFLESIALFVQLGRDLCGRQRSGCKICHHSRSGCNTRHNTDVCRYRFLGLSTLCRLILLYVATFAYAASDQFCSWFFLLIELFYKLFQS